MKILILNNLFYPYNRGGAEQVVKKMAEKLALDNEVLVMTTKPSGDKAAFKDNENHVFRIHYLDSYYYDLRNIPYGIRIFWHLGNIFSFRKYYLFKKILREEKPDVVITHNLVGLGFLLPLAIREAGIRHEHYLHDIQLLHPSGLMLFGKEKILKSFPARFYQRLTRLLFSSPALVISPSRWLLNLHLKHNFFPDSETEITTEGGTNGQRLDKGTARSFLYVGQVETHKGIFLLIEAFKRIGNKDIRLEIVGDGSSLSAAKALAGTDDRISFHGRLESDEVANIMHSCDRLIVPSLCYENSPTVIVEAHEAGLAVLAADIGGIPELMRSGDRLLRPGDVSDLEQKIRSQI